MNIKHLLILLISVFVLSSCGDDQSENTERKYSVDVNNDIESFNIETGEIVLKSGEIVSEHLSSIEEFQSKIGLYSIVTFYLDNDPLFESISMQPEYSSLLRNDLVFVLDGSRFYLLNGYPSLESLGANKSTWEIIREENFEKRKASWNRFINYLKATGKLIE